MHARMVCRRTRRTRTRTGGSTHRGAIDCWDWAADYGNQSTAHPSICCRAVLLPPIHPSIHLPSTHPLVLGAHNSICQTNTRLTGCIHTNQCVHTVTHTHRHQYGHKPGLLHADRYWRSLHFCNNFNKITKETLDKNGRFNTGSKQDATQHPTLEAQLRFTG